MLSLVHRSYPPMPFLFVRIYLFECYIFQHITYAHGTSLALSLHLLPSTACAWFASTTYHMHPNCSCHTALNHLDPYILYKFFRGRISSRLNFCSSGERSLNRIESLWPKRKIKKTSRKQARKAQCGGSFLTNTQESRFRSLTIRRTVSVHTPEI